MNGQPNVLGIPDAASGKMYRVVIYRKDANSYWYGPPQTEQQAEEHLVLQMFCAPVYASADEVIWIERVTPSRSTPLRKICKDGHQ